MNPLNSKISADSTHLQGMGASDGQHNALNPMVSHQDIAWFQHACKTLLHQDILFFDAQSAEDCGLDGQLPLSQGLAKFHEVCHPLKLLLQAQYDH